MAVHVREAGSEELEAVDELVMAANEEFRDGIPVRFRADWERYHRRSLERAERGRVLVVEEDGRLVGTVAVVRNSETPDTVEVEGLAMLPSARRRGVATSLMDAAVQTGHELGATAVEWFTAPYMQGAVDFSEALGFRPVEEVEGPSAEGPKVQRYRLRLDQRTCRLS